MKVAIVVIYALAVGSLGLAVSGAALLAAGRTRRPFRTAWDAFRLGYRRLEGGIVLAAERMPVVLDGHVTADGRLELERSDVRLTSGTTPVQVAELRSIAWEGQPDREVAVFGQLRPLESAGYRASPELGLTAELIADRTRVERALREDGRPLRRAGAAVLALGLLPWIGLLALMIRFVVAAVV